MRRDPRLVRLLAWVALGAAAALLAWVLLTGALMGSVLPPDVRSWVATWLVPHLPLAVMTGVVFIAAVAALANRLYRDHVAPLARLAEQAKVMLGSDDAQPIEPRGNAFTRALADTLNQFVQQRRALLGDVQDQVAQASRRVEQERGRLAALMSELTQAVVVCNLDGRILLYNQRAKFQFRALSEAPQLADGAELIGLGRSIYAVFDRQLVAHALDSVQQRLSRGALNPTAQFVTATRGGQLLRAQMAPVRSGDGAQHSLDGFVLMLENITRDQERDAAQEQLLVGLTEGQRSSLGNLQAAVELLEDPELDAPTRERFLAVVRDEVGQMSQRIRELATQNTEAMRTRWPLEQMLGADLVGAARRRIAALGPRAGTQAVDATLWLKVDSFALIQVLAYLAGRLIEEFGVKSLQLRLQRAGERAQLDLIWSGQAMSTETVMSWESEAMRQGSALSALSVRDVMQRHGGEFWFERDRVRHEAFFRLLLPLADVAGADPTPVAAAAMRGDSRPEYYDFDLFQATGGDHSLDDRRLVELTYTVFDTETTGLEPSEGDEIIQVGAARIVNGKLLRQESFEQLVDPQREIPARTIPIHGIRPEMVQGQPTIDTVLPAFHAFARDTVLVAHNAAFDMRFLQLKEERCGVRFDQPVLDTLLLSALVHPSQESHKLEAIAERFGLTIIGRHTALGDAMVTAEVLLKLLPLLAEMGIHTLGQAREAAQKTYFARIKY